MSFITTQAGRISATENNGVLRSSIPLVDPIKAVTVAQSVTSVKVLHGNDDGTGIKYSDKSTAVNDFSVDDVPLFDSSNPNNDRLCIALAEVDDVEHTAILLSRAGVYTGQLQVATQYKRASDNVWVTSSYVNADFTSTGMKNILSDIKYSDIAFTDDLIDPAGEPQHKCLNILFKGITAVTTAPLASRIWLHRKSTATKAYTDFTNLVKGTYTGTDTLQLLPHQGDVSLIGFAKPFAKMHAVITRPRVSEWQTELVYVTASGEIKAVPTANILSASSALTGDELWTRPAGTYVDVFIPPSDWGLFTIDNQAAYYFGWRYTADAAAPGLVLQVKVQGQTFDTTAIGMTTGEATTYTVFDINTIDISPSATVFLIANDRTGDSITTTLPANSNSAESVISFQVQSTDQLLFQVLSAHPLVTPADLLLRLS